MMRPKEGGRDRIISTPGRETAWERLVLNRMILLFSSERMPWTMGRGQLSLQRCELWFTVRGHQNKKLNERRRQASRSPATEQDNADDESEFHLT